MLSPGSLKVELRNRGERVREGAVTAKLKMVRAMQHFWL